jgi:N-acetylmuramic acid 6-phosphate (MurNAc-6-P) etherase
LVAVTPTNAKVRARAVRIVSRIGRVPEERARELLDASEWDVPSALVAGRLSVSVADAAERLRSAGGDVARVLGD